MKRLKRLVCLLMLLCMTAGIAHAEAMLFPQLNAWKLDEKPLRITLSVDVSQWMPFDETRTGWLNALLKHITLEVNTQKLEEERWSSLRLLVDGNEALNMRQKQTGTETQMLLSSMPDKCYVAGTESDALSLLLGEKDESVFGMDESTLSYLTDAYDLACGLNVALSDWGEEKTIKTAIEKMGTARKKITYVVPREDAPKLPEALGGLCVEGRVQTLVKSLIFSGKQTFTTYFSGDDELLKVTYSGQCGVSEEQLRNVSITWSMKRSDNEIRDTFQLKSPALKGSDRNTVTLTRVEKVKNSTTTLTLTAKHEQVQNKVKNILAVDCDLKAAQKNGATTLTGTLSVKNTPEDEDLKEQLMLTPNLTLAGTDATDDYVSGTVEVEQRAGSRLSRVTAKATVNVKVAAGEYFDWMLSENVVNLSALGEKELADVRKEVADAVGTDLIRPLVLLPKDDTLYLSADMDEATWQKVVDTAQAALKEDAR